MSRDVYETARRLRRLTLSPNEHEAAQAREKYQEYTTQHRISLEDEPVLPLTLAETLQFFERQQRERERRWAEASRVVREAQVKAERSEIEYLRRLPRAKRDERLRHLPPAQQAEYRRQFEVLRQASRAKRRERRRKERCP